MRPLLIIIMVPLWAAFCSARPGWVHSMPQSSGLASGVPSAIPSGTWERNARNRHPVIHRTHYSDAREIIETRPDQTYTKVHLFAQVTDNAEKLVAYRETGRWTPGAGRWVLFQPDRAEKFEGVFPLKNRLRGPDTRYPFPGLDQIGFAPVSRPDSLLYLHEEDAGQQVLLPASYERLGRVYNFGVYEGSEDAFDSSSENFEKTKKIYLARKFQELHYALRQKSE
jgi:hypothetical protein